MLSFIIPARSLPDETQSCLVSILLAVRTLRIEHRCEFILLDDESDPALGLTTLFKQFRAGTRQPVKIYRFKKNQHYTGVFAHGLSFATGDRVFFISNDMVITPNWLKTILAVAALDPTFGIVRGTADIVDSHPEHSFVPPFDPVETWDVERFSQYMSDQFGLMHTEDTLLSGDAVCISRALLDTIGVFDKRYFSYFGDIDFGLRARRCGFKLVCAKGAWLRHRVAGYVRAQREAEKITQEQSSSRRMALVQAAYELFRLKWDHSLPPKYAGDMPLTFDHLLTAAKPKGFDFVPALKADPALVETL
jgi:GT2 family glycosyltransferase